MERDVLDAGGKTPLAVLQHFGTSLPGEGRYPTLRDGGIDLLQEIRRWFTRWMLPEAYEEGEDPQVRTFIMGTGRWERLSGWPPPGSLTERLYLGSDAGANSSRGDGELAGRPPAVVRADTLEHDPTDPVPSVGGALWPIQFLEPGPLDQREVEGREDVLVYTGRPLESPVTLLGPVAVTLWTAADKPLYDVVVKLVDLHPDGYAQILTDGVRRVRPEGTDADPRPVRVPMAATGHTLGAGHRLRLEVSGSHFPKYEIVRGPFRLTVYTGGHFSSHVEYAVAPED